MLTMLLLCACTNTGTDSEAACPVKSSMVYNDTFRITYVSRQYEYDSGKMKKEAPLYFELWIEYIGKDSSVTIWHREAIGGVEMLYNTGESVLPLVIGDSLGSMELQKGESFLVCTWTGASEYEFLGGFPRGNYIAEACVDFDFGENGEESVCCFLDLPFTIV